MILMADSPIKCEHCHGTGKARVVDKGRIAWRTPANGDAGELKSDNFTHADVQELNDCLEYTRHWLKGCDCDACEMNRGANEDI